MISPTHAAWSRHALIPLSAFVAGVLCAEVVSPFGLAVLARAGKQLLYYVADHDTLATAAPLVAIAAGTAGLVIIAFSIRHLNANRHIASARQQPIKPSVPPVDRHMIVDRVRDGLEVQLNKLVDTVGHYLESTQIQSASYEGIKASLASANTVDKVEAIVAVLKEASARGQRDIAQLRSSLHEAKAQSVELRRQLDETEQRASLDPLTELPNRRHFDTFLNEAIQEAHTAYLPLCLVMADIDHFKRLNDTYGHQTGDAVITNFAQLLKSGVRSSDLVARYGGEEFVLVLKRSALGTAADIAENLRSKIASSKWVDPYTGKDIGSVTASFGIAEVLDAESAPELIARADKELYAAKNSGRNRVAMASGTGHGVRRAANLVMRKAAR